MGNVVKCPACNAFFNGSIYSGCPYCSQNVVKKETPVQPQEVVTEKPKGLRGLFGKKVRTAELSSKEDGQANGKNENADIIVEHSGVQATMPLEMNNQITDETPVERMMEDSIPIPMTEPLVKSVEPQPVKELSLQQQISRTGRTVGKYISGKNGESISPVVGWLVCIKGAHVGQSFNLKKGKNRIGRSYDMDVKLVDDDSVSKTCVATIIYDAKFGEFSIVPGESDSLCYINDKALYERSILNNYDELELGDSGINKFIFVRFCGSEFQWPSNMNE